MSIVNQLRTGSGSFDPETNLAMSMAFERAWKAIKDSGSLLAEGSRAEATRDVLAKRIIELTLKGERDPARLCEQALALQQSQ
jgi:hypothetical protein